MAEQKEYSGHYFSRKEMEERTIERAKQENGVAIDASAVGRGFAAVGRVEREEGDWQTKSARSSPSSLLEACGNTPPTPSSFPCPDSVQSDVAHKKTLKEEEEGCPCVPAPQENASKSWRPTAPQGSVSPFGGASIFTEAGVEYCPSLAAGVPTPAGTSSGSFKSGGMFKGFGNFSKIAGDALEKVHNRLYF